MRQYLIIVTQKLGYTYVPAEITKVAYEIDSSKGWIFISCYFRFKFTFKYFHCEKRDFEQHDENKNSYRIKGIVTDIKL